MRVIKPKRIEEFAQQYAVAKSALEKWLAVVLVAKWTNLVELNKTYPSTDYVRVSSEKSVIVFNIKGNDFRLICAVHFNTEIVYVLRFLTHAEYDKNNWEKEL